MKKCMQKIENMPLQTSSIFPVLDKNLLVFPVKSSVYLYSDRKPRACQKLGVGPGVGKCPAPGQRKICKCPTPGTDKAGKCSAVARGGGGRGWAQLELTDKAHLFWQISSNDVKLDWYANAIFAASKAIVASSENQIPIQHVIQKLLIWLDIPDYPTGLENCVRPCSAREWICSYDYGRISLW